MFEPIDLLVLSLCYLLVLFAIAHIGDKFPQRWVRHSKPVVIALAGTYTTAWMFFGTPAQAVNNGWYIPPTFLGSIIVLLVFPGFLRRLIKASKRAHSTSIADFIASYYGKSQSLAIMITLVAIVAVLPYVALQLKAVAMSYHTLTGQDLRSSTTPIWQDTALYIALLMAVFTIMFGTRHIDSKEHHNGLMIAVAFEAIVKIICFAAIGYYTCFILFDGVEDLVLTAARSPAIETLIAGRAQDSGFIAATVLGMTALFCLPRQFHILMVESESPNDCHTYRWLIPLYMIIISFFILPIGYGGYLLLFESGLHPESFSLQLPMSNQQPLLTLAAYIGGLSAGSSMVIISCIALATMICNHMVMPLLLRQRILNIRGHEDVTGLLRLIRRAAIVILLLLAYTYYRLLAGYTDLGSIGLLALVLVAQFSPAVVGALYWQNGHHKGVQAGLAVGFIIWIYTLIVPSLVHTGWLPDTILSDGLFGIAWLRPEQLFNLNWSPLSNGVWWSLAGNVATYIGVSIGYRKLSPESSENNLNESGYIAVADLRDIAARFLGHEQARLALQSYEGEFDSENIHQPASKHYLDFVESLLAGVIGASSAHQVLHYARQGVDSPLELIDETSSVFQYNRELLEASFNNITQGISVIDQNLQLVAWNRRYLELFSYPQEMIHVGRNVADLVRYNAERGECGPGSVEQHVRKRVEHLRKGSSYVFQRVRSDNTVLEIRGNHMPGGGFVTTYTDITEFSRAMSELENTKSHLEERVEQRTAELAQATATAEKSNDSKTRFLAAVGHDLVQPLNASRLFISALQQRPLDVKARHLVEQLAASAQAAESLINALLDIAKLEAGAVKASTSTFNVSSVLQPLASEFHLLAKERQLGFHFHSSSLSVKSDNQLLRRIIQNLLSNALRYTNSGRIVLGCRRSARHLKIQVWDTGIGIAQQHQQEIFVEFNRLIPESVENAQDGLGLGLATVKHLCELLNHKIEVQSSPGKGSVFTVYVPISQHHQIQQNAGENNAITANPQQLQGLKILCIDNDATILAGLEALLESWHCEVIITKSLEQALTHTGDNPPDVIIADYHLDHNQNGIDCVKSLFAAWQVTRPCIVISADWTETVRTRAQKQGFLFLRKPVKTAALRATLNHAALRLNSQGQLKKNVPD